MAKRKGEFPEETRLKILKQDAQGDSSRAIARELGGISSSGVSRFLRKVRNHNTIKDLPRSGRPRKIPPNLLGYIKLQLKRGQLNNAADVKRDLQATVGLKISKHCIFDSLKREGYKVFRLVKKPYLTHKQRAARLEQAKEWIRNPPLWQNNIVFTDEVQVHRISKGNTK